MTSPSRHRKNVAEWLQQARYDLDTARYLYEGKRYPYAAYLAQLAIEKALKGLYRHRFEENPPVTHDLGYLADRTELLVPEELRPFLEELNEASILNLYPDRVFGKDCSFDPPAVRRLLAQSEEVLDWITDHVPEDLRPGTLQGKGEGKTG